LFGVPKGEGVTKCVTGTTAIRVDVTNGRNIGDIATVGDRLDIRRIRCRFFDRDPKYDTGCDLEHLHVHFLFVVVITTFVINIPDLSKKQSGP